jgi:hypothetical protein
VVRGVDGEHRRWIDRADARPWAGQPQRRLEHGRQAVGAVAPDLPEGVAAQHIGADVVVDADPREGAAGERCPGPQSLVVLVGVLADGGVEEDLGVRVAGPCAGPDRQPHRAVGGPPPDSTRTTTSTASTADRTDTIIVRVRSSRPATR